MDARANRPQASTGAGSAIRYDSLRHGGARMKLYRGTEQVGTTAPDRPAEQRSVAGFALESLHRLAVSFLQLSSPGPGLKAGLALLMAVLREFIDECG